MPLNNLETLKLHLPGVVTNCAEQTDINNVQVTDFFVRDLYTVQNGRAKDPIYTID